MSYHLLECLSFCTSECLKIGFDKLSLALMARDLNEITKSWINCLMSHRKTPDKISYISLNMSKILFV